MLSVIFDIVIEPSGCGETWLKVERASLFSRAQRVSKEDFLGKSSARGNAAEVMLRLSESGAAASHSKAQARNLGGGIGPTLWSAVPIHRNRSFIGAARRLDLQRSVANHRHS